MPATLGLPLCRLSVADVARHAPRSGLVARISDSTVRRWLHEDAIRPWQLTSLGERGADTVWGVIYPPQVAIVGFGRIAERPWVVDGQVAARPLVALSLAADHRTSDGHLGGQLLAVIDQALQNPDKL
jgi:hypothetical protein